MAEHVANGIIVNMVNRYNQFCVLKYGQLLAGLAQSMNNSGMRDVFQQ